MHVFFIKKRESDYTILENTSYNTPYISYTGGTPYSVRSSIRYYMGYSILCKKDMK